MAEPRERFALPSNGWRPGMPYVTAGTDGPLHAERDGRGGAQAWLGTSRRGTTWPFGWTVRFGPTELLSPDGDVFAREGEWVSAACGFDANGDLALGPLERTDPVWKSRLQRGSRPTTAPTD
jgi:hypothetical protein